AGARIHQLIACAVIQGERRIAAETSEGRGTEIIGDSGGDIEADKGRAAKTRDLAAGCAGAVSEVPVDEGRVGRNRSHDCYPCVLVAASCIRRDLARSL